VGGQESTEGGGGKIWAPKGRVSNRERKKERKKKNKGESSGKVAIVMGSEKKPITGRRWKIGKGTDNGCEGVCTKIRKSNRGGGKTET